MRTASFSGWARLGVVASFVWLLFAASLIISDWPYPKIYGWVHTSSPTPSDPLGLFERIVWLRAVALFVLPVAILWTAGIAGAWVRDGFEARWSNPLSHPGRLADVLALLQVMALGKFTHRSEDHLQRDLQGLPQSAETWTAVARQHPELFRVNGSTQTPVSLLGRHAGMNETNADQNFPTVYWESILGLVVDLHDRQVKRARAWELFLPILVALLAGALGVVGALIRP